MAWTAPVTWVDGQIPTAALFNQQFRDNHNELALHAHAGGSGSGTAALGPLSNATFSDAPAPTGAGGTVTRVYSTVGTVGWVSASGSVFLAANTTHEHILTAVQTLPANGSSTGTGSSIDAHEVTRVNATAHVVSSAATLAASMAVQTATIGGNGSRRVFISGAVVTYESNNGSGTVRFSILRDSTVLTTALGIYATASNQAVPVRMSTSEVLDTGSYTYSIRGSFVS